MKTLRQFLIFFLFSYFVRLACNINKKLKAVMKRSKYSWNWWHTNTIHSNVESVKLENCLNSYNTYYILHDYKAKSQEKIFLKFLFLFFFFFSSAISNRRIQRMQLNWRQWPKNRNLFIMCCITSLMNDQQMAWNLLLNFFCSIITLW